MKLLLIFFEIIWTKQTLKMEKKSHLHLPQHPPPLPYTQNNLQRQDQNMACLTTLDSFKVTVINLAQGRVSRHLSLPETVSILALKAPYLHQRTGPNVWQQMQKFLGNKKL